MQGFAPYPKRQMKPVHRCMIIRDALLKEHQPVKLTPVYGTDTSKEAGPALESGLTPIVRTLNRLHPTDRMRVHPKSE